MDRQLIDYLPQVARAMRELRAITDGQQDELSILWDAVDAVFDDQFIDDATTNGIVRWEKILSITSKGTDAIDTRRFRIKTRLSEQLPFTMKVLHQRLAALCGSDGYALKMERGEYILHVKVSLVAKNNLDDVANLLERIVPAEIVVDLSLQYNTHKVLSLFTHKALAVYAHHDLRTKVLKEINCNTYLFLSRQTHEQLSGLTYRDVRKEVEKDA